MSAQEEYESLKPARYQRVIDVLEQAGIDVSRWGEYKGKHASTNPQIYQWSFEQPGERTALFIWWTDIRVEGERLSCIITPREPTGQNRFQEAKWKASSNRFLRHIQNAFEQELPIAAVIVDGSRFNAENNPRASQAQRRLLDTTPWAVVEFDPVTRHGLIVRGLSPVHPETRSVDVELAGFEGWKRKAFIWHRHREAALRRAKIEEVKNANGGRLACQVPRCGFEFGRQYGQLGEGYAHVHHLAPLSKSPGGRTVTLSELAVVCPNCHAMIHLGGKCRELDTLIPLSP